MSSKYSVILPAWFALSLSACGHSPVISEYSATAKPGEEIQKLEVDIQAARERQANVFSPNNFSEASEAFSDAKEAKANGKENKKVLHYLAVSRAYLNEANTITAQVETSLPEIAKARRDAITGGALTLQKQELEEVDEDLVDVTEDFESGQRNVNAKDREKLKDRYLNIELAAISRTRLSEARDLIHQAKKEGASKLAPRSLSSAEEKLKRAEEAITTDRHNNELLDKVSAEATNEARHLLEILQLASQAKGESVEQIALELDSKKKAITLKEKELQNASVTNVQKTQELTEKEKQLAVLAGTNVSLEREKKFNESFETARKQFSPEEADVYRQGDSLLIRLKGLNFKSGHAELDGSSFSLLAKVKDVIAGVNTEKLIVEGHTDAIGGKEINEKLSAERADAVSKYLIAEKAVDEGKIISQGFGFTKPLASNKSKEGRAQNRRVDLIMTLAK